jgi:hypothetical protein
MFGRWFSGLDTGGECGSANDAATRPRPESAKLLRKRDNDALRPADVR